MFLFQVYAEVKSKDDEESGGTSMGVKLRAKKKENYGPKDILPPAYLLEKAFDDKEVAEFVSSLTPGMQHAIYAASFSMGFENSAKCVKNAMKAEEVKNSAEPAAKSQAVAENIKSQASNAPTEKQREVSNFVWSYYNENLKESQAEVSKSESLSETINTGQTVQQEISIPHSAREAVALSVAGESHTPSLIYCAASMQVIDEEKEKQAAETKRGELLRIMQGPGASEEGAITDKTAEIKAVQSAELVVLKRREELVKEYGKLEQDLAAAIRLIENHQGTVKERLDKAADLLPEELASAILSKEKGMSRRRALRAQLIKWIAFSRNGRNSVLSMPASKLLKLAALSSLLKLGK